MGIGKNVSQPLVYALYVCCICATHTHACTHMAGLLSWSLRFTVSVSLNCSSYSGACSPHGVRCCGGCAHCPAHSCPTNLCPHCSPAHVNLCPTRMHRLMLGSIHSDTKNVIIVLVILPSTVLLTAVPATLSYPTYGYHPSVKTGQQLYI